MEAGTQERQRLGVGFIPGQTWLAGLEVEHLGAGETIEVDPDVKAYPRPFSRAPRGNYQFMALLDPDHSYPYTEQNAGDLYSPVARATGLDPANCAPVALALERVTEARFRPADTEIVKQATFESPRLSAFWGRPISTRAGVVLPPSYAKEPGRSYPAVYHVHGFGGDWSEAWFVGPRWSRAMGEGKRAEMVHVFLDGSFPTGHHEFADSVNNGPWGAALTQEFIPYLEKTFHLVPKPGARFLTGHSSGGWSTLWLQVTYPDFFGGTWSTAPDPVDLRSFTGINVTPGSTDNVYRKPDGTLRNLVRADGKEVASMEAFARLEGVEGEVGGQMASFEWVWSPKGPDGRPMALFNRVTGEQDPQVQRAWQKYDIRRVLEQNWASLGPKLGGKLHVICGAEDTFHLEEATRLLADFLHRAGSDAVCEIIPGRDHMNLYAPHPNYPEGLEARIDREMAAMYRKNGTTDERR
jgi:S-formylglutathione hydrolase FrmB